MNKIKFLKKERIELNKVVYRPYNVCDLPLHFGCIAMFRDENGVPTKDGINKWFNYKGLTYIIE